MVVYLICGFKRTGKNALADELVYTRSPQANGFSGKSFLDVSWKVLRNPNKSIHGIIKTKPECVSFAGEVKREVMGALGLDSEFDLEKNKDVYLVEGKPIRQHLIDYAESKKVNDKYYWSTLAFKNIDIKETDVVVSDWRFMSEFEYVSKLNTDIVTIRVFRKDVPIPDKNINSEHELDSFKTDYVLIPLFDTEKEIGSLLDVFPQYADYIPL